MCVSRDREMDSLVNTMEVFGSLYMYNNSNRKKMIISIVVTFFFFIFDNKTLILYAFMTTKTMQIYLYIGVNYMAMF